VSCTCTFFKQTEFKLHTGNYKTWLLITALFLPVSSALFAQEAGDRLSWHGQVRSGYYFNTDQAATGISSTDHEWRTRLRLGIQYQVSSDLMFRTRAAGRYSTIQDRFRFTLDDHTAGATGIRLGETTIDEFNVTWTPAEKIWIRGGRFQLSFPLRGVAQKGLNRYDAPNTSVVFTDGLWVRVQFHESWEAHLVSEYNSPSGASSAVRSPLRFDDSGSRVSWWGMVRHRNTEGFWKQREFSVNILPNTFEKDGSVQNYIVLISRLGINIPVEMNFADLTFGIEGGYVPNIPPSDALGFSDQDTIRDDAFAWQAALNFNNMDIFGLRHNTAFLYGQTDPGWLTSPSFIPNSRTYEVRHQIWFTSVMSFEFRYRFRSQRKIPAAALQGREIHDIYARITYRI